MSDGVGYRDMRPGVQVYNLTKFINSPYLLIRFKIFAVDSNLLYDMNQNILTAEKYLHSLLPYFNNLKTVGIIQC